MDPKVKTSWSSPACVGSMPVQVWPSTSIYFSSYDACVLSMPVQVLPSTSLYFVGYGPSNTCILYLQEPVESPARPKEQTTFHISNQECMLVGDDAAATCCMEEDVSLGNSYGSLAVLLHTGACSQSVSVSTDGSIWQQHPAFWSAWATRNCYHVSRWVATAAHACFIVAQSCALFVVVCSQLGCLLLLLRLKVMVHVPASDQHEQHEVLQSEREREWAGSEWGPHMLFFSSLFNIRTLCFGDKKIDKFYVPLSLLSKRNIMYHVSTSLDWAACHLKFRRWEPEWTLTCVLCLCAIQYVFFFVLAFCFLSHVSVTLSCFVVIRYLVVTFFV